jgi:hypothetical protein
MALFSKNADASAPAAPSSVSAKSIREKYDRASKALLRERFEYSMNRSFIAGDQWVRWDNSNNRVRPAERDAARVRVTFNRLKPASRHLMSKLLSRPLVFEVPPADTDDATVRGAHTSEAVLADLHREHKWEDLREETAWNAWLGGTSVLALDWDASAGTTIDHMPLTGQPVGTGEIVESVLSIAEVAWEPGTRDAERGYWWIRSQALPPEEVQLRYGLKDKPAADASAALAGTGRALISSERGDAPVDLALVLTYYERPSKKNPQGAVATVVGNKLVDGPKPWPFPFTDRLNMCVTRETKVSGRATGDTVFSDAVQVQVAYNASWSNLIEHLKLAGNARLLVPDSALDGVDELTDLPAEIIEYATGTGNAKPEWLTPAYLPQWVIDQPQALAAEMDDMLGWHDASRGVAPGAMESGVGLSILVEQDSTPLGGLTREIARVFERFARMVLLTYEAKVTETRKAHIKVPGQLPEVVGWTGKALAHQTVVEIPMDAVMPRSRAAMLSFAERMLSIGALPKDRPDVFAKMADIPDYHKFLAAVDHHADKAMRENQLMAIGQVVVPMIFDDHAKHIARHNEFRCSARYDAMTEEERQLVDLHVQAHEVYAAEEMGKQVAKAMANPALAAVPTASGAAALPAGMVPAGAAGGPEPLPAPDGAPANAAPPEGALSEPAEAPVV